MSRKIGSRENDMSWLRRMSAGSRIQNELLKEEPGKNGKTLTAQSDSVVGGTTGLLVSF